MKKSQLFFQVIVLILLSNLNLKSETIIAWGNNNNGQLGDSTNTTRNIPSKIGTAIDWKLITTGHNHTLAIKNDGNLLPLHKGKVKKVAIVGEFAQKPVTQGDGSAYVKGITMDKPYEDLKEAFDERVEPQEQ